MAPRTRGQAARIDPHDPNRADKWGYTDDEIQVVIPGLQPAPEESATPEQEVSDAATESRQGRA